MKGIATSIWAHGVVVSHPLSMREALGSIPSVSILAMFTAAAMLYSGGQRKPWKVAGGSDMISSAHLVYHSKILGGPTHMCCADVQFSMARR